MLISAPDPASIDRLLLKEAKGATKRDKFVFFCIRNVYIGLRILSRIALGKKKRDKLYLERGISFRGFLYKSIEFLNLDSSFLLVFNVPEYDYKFYSRATRKIPNFLIQDMYASMTIHEEDIRKYFNPKRGDIVIDIGAAFGLYTITSSKQVGANGKVIAIEAHPGNYEMLNHNIKLNGLTNVIPLNYAVYSKETKIKLFLPDEESGYTMHHSVMFNYLSSKYPLQGKDNEKFIEVNANTLDNLLQKNGISQVNWIKIDVEGAEFEVLKGSANILSTSKDINLLIEIHNPGDTNHYKQIIDFLKSYNFKIEFEKIYESGERHMVTTKI
jgi:FkbM family methyltransferase